MILYIEYNGGAGDQMNLDLVGSSITCETFEPGIFGTPGVWVTDAVARIVIKGRPAISAATNTIADLQVRVQTSINRDIGARVYLYWHPTGDSSDVHRAIIYSMQFMPEGGSGEFYIQNRMVKAQLIITHGPWEGQLTQVPITNANGTNNISGLTVQNTLDATRDNTIAIAANIIQGDLPTPARIEMTFTKNDSAYVLNVFIAQNVNSDPANFVPILEGEAASGGSNFASATASGGNYKELAVTVNDTAKLRFTLSSALCTQAAGNQFHVFATYYPAHTAEALTFIRLELVRTAASSAYYTSEQVSQAIVAGSTIGNQFSEIGMLRLPPWYIDAAATSAAMDLLLYTQSTDGGVYTLNIDFLYLMPVDSFRQLQIISAESAYFARRLVDDQIDHDLYIDSGAGTARVGDIVPSGTQVYLQPGKYQKLYFLTNSNDANYDIAKSMTIKLYYRPLRLTL